MNKKQLVLWIKGAIFLSIIIISITLSCVYREQNGTINFSALLLCDVAILIAAFAVEVSFVSYIGESSFNRVYQDDVFKGLTINTIFDGSFFLAMSITASMLSVFLPFSAYPSVFVCLSSIFGIGISYFSLYSSSKRANPDSQIKAKITSAISHYKLISNNQTDRKSEFNQLQTLFEDSYNKGEYKCCENITSAFVDAEKEIFSEKNSAILKEKEKDFKEQKGITAGYLSYFLSFSYPLVGSNPNVRLLLKIIDLAAKVEKCENCDVLDDLEKIVLRFFYKQNPKSEEYKYYYQNTILLVAEDPDENDPCKLKIIDELLSTLLKLSYRFSVCYNQSLFLRTSARLIEKSVSIEQYEKRLSLFSKILFQRGEPDDSSDAMVWLGYVCGWAKNEKDPNYLKLFFQRIMIDNNVDDWACQNVDFAYAWFNQIDNTFLKETSFVKEALEIRFQVSEKLPSANFSIYAITLLPPIEDLYQLIKDKQIREVDILEYCAQTLQECFTNDRTSYAAAIFDILINLTAAESASKRVFNYGEIISTVIEALFPCKQITEETASLICEKLYWLTIQADKASALKTQDIKDLIDLAKTTDINIKGGQPRMPFVYLLQNLVEGRETLKIYLKSPSLMIETYQAIAAIGFSAIESGNDLTAKNVSGILGWAVINRFEDNNPKLADEILESALSLFNNSAELSPIETASFIGTLVIVVGSYFTYKKEDQRLLDLLHDLNPTENEKVILRKSYMLRSIEGDDWAKTLGDHALDQMNTFYDKLENYLDEPDPKESFV